MTSYDIMNVGVIGTGLLGRSVAKRLLETGHNVTVYNRTKEKADPLRDLGAYIVESPKEVAENSDIILTIVKDSAAVESVSFGEQGIVKGRREGLVVADMSTINPISSKLFAKEFDSHGITLIDSPVMGGPSLAEKGQLVVMIGGPEEAYQKCKQVFNCIGQKTFYLGSNGSAESMKLALNLQISILALSLSEGMILARKSGLDPLLFLEVLNSTYFKTGMSLNKGPKMAKGVFEPSFFLNVMQKDLDEINYMAKEVGARLPIAKIAGEIYHDAVREGFGKIDYTGIMAYLEQINKTDR